MKISKAHLIRLKKSKEMRGKSISTISSFLSVWKCHLITITYFSVCAFIVFHLFGATYAFFILGALLGVLLRDFAWNKLLSQFWPVSDFVTDWDKVDQLIDENDK